MMSAKKLFKFLSKAFYFSLISLFVSSAYAISDVGYVGEDETEITVERSYAKLPSFPRKALRLGREGYVVVEFDIDTDGAVLDP